MLFEVTLSDGTTRTMQAHHKKQLVEALQGVVLTNIIKRPSCKACHKTIATIQHCLCAECYAEAVAHYREACPDLPLEGQELESLLCSFFIEGS